MRIEAFLPNLAPTLRQLAADAQQTESAGLIVSGKVVPAANRAADPTRDFDVGSLGELEDQHGQPCAIYHTHPQDVPPSPPDLVNCQATALPWVIVTPRRIFVTYPEKQAYFGRVFAYGIQDCFTLVSDYYAQERGVFLPWFERPDPSWWHDPAAVNPYLTHARDCGFQVMPWAEVGVGGLEAGDVILMRVAARQTNHAAVYLGGGIVMHHLWDQLSRSELFDHRLQRFTTAIARYRGALPC